MPELLQVVKKNAFSSESEYARDTSTTYIMPEGYRALIKGACDDFGVTPFHMARLLGLKETRQIYRWISLNPRVVRRPASRFMARLAMLYKLQAKGVILVRYDYINWKTGVAVSDAHKTKGDPRNGNKTIPLTRRRTLPYQERRAG